MNCRLLDNIEWYKDMNVVDFLSDTGRHFRLSSMLQKDRCVVCVQCGHMHGPGGADVTVTHVQCEAAAV